ncbi:MAG: Fic family protein [Phascolarctobacterium sp.]|uniref:protein adenylyltransferase Fic n=1 Tax=Phascolarctobacterium sp. TaxID=2049039 RepID=UPI0026DDA02A|nr:Fic family protein [Phascolarctobacterium sp.]MDO4921548.1 Fic family protein [Phascolarctobacterium sp.]
MTIENKLGLTDASELARAEERLSKMRALELFEKNLLQPFTAGSFKTLAFIHGHLFQDVYAFAGQIRKVNLAKGNFRFAPLLYLQEALKNVDQMPQSTFDAVVEKYVEMNIVHPFREGNGRSMRIWLDDMLKKELGQCIDWRLVDKEDYLLAMERSPIRDIEIKHILRLALTEDIFNRQVYMKGVDISYHFEGYNTFRTEDL